MLGCHPPPRPGTAPPPGPGTAPPGAGNPLGVGTPGAEHAGRYGQRAGGTHPTKMQSCIMYIL